MAPPDPVNLAVAPTDRHIERREVFIDQFIQQALLGEPLTVFGDGQQTRSFCYVDDLVEGLLRLMATADDYDARVRANAYLALGERALDIAERRLQGSRYKVPRQVAVTLPPAVRVKLEAVRSSTRRSLCSDTPLTADPR